MVRPATGPAPALLDPAEVAEHFRAADAASRRFEPGWVVVDPGEAQALIGPARSPWQVPVARGEEGRWIDPVDLHFDAGVGLRPPAGSAVAVSARRDSSDLLPAGGPPRARPVQRLAATGPPVLVRATRGDLPAAGGLTTRSTGPALRPQVPADSTAAGVPTPWCCTSGGRLGQLRAGLAPATGASGHGCGRGFPPSPSNSPPGSPWLRTLA